jgi:hypothetical protein
MLPKSEKAGTRGKRNYGGQCVKGRRFFGKLLAPKYWQRAKEKTLKRGKGELRVCGVSSRDHTRRKREVRGRLLRVQRLVCNTLCERMQGEQEK